MAIAHVQSRVTTGSGTSLALAYNSNNAAGNLLTASITGGDNEDNFTNFTDSNSNSWSNVTGGLVNAGDSTVVELGYAPNSNSGANTVTANFSSSNFSTSLSIHEYSGVATTSPLETSATDTSGGGDSSIEYANVTTSTAECLLVGVSGGDRAFATVTPSASYTERADSAAARWHHYMDRIVTSTGTYNAVSTLSGNGSWSSIHAAFKAAAGGGGGATPKWFSVVMGI